MSKYSHSGLEDYRNCPLKFKFKYKDKLKQKEGIEAFLGKNVHEVLHYIYRNAKNKAVPTLKQVLAYYEELWKKNYNKEIRIVKRGFSADNYFEEGIKMLKSYYEKNYPFKENIIGMEKQILINFDKEGMYILIGFIDKLIKNLKDGSYEIHDYKTSNRLPEQEQLDEDKQLALYALGIKEEYPDAKKIMLKWHFLKHGKELTSFRTDKQLKELKEETMRLIKKIEAEKEWPARKSSLCDWCGFNHVCAEYKSLL